MQHALKWGSAFTTSLQVMHLANTPPVPSDELYHDSYTLDCYKRNVRALLEYSAAWLQSLGSHILQLDAGFKLHSDGMVTVLSGEGYVLAIWIGTSSLWCLVAYLAALGRRCAKLGKVGYRAFACDPTTNCAVGNGKEQRLVLGCMRTCSLSPHVYPRDTQDVRIVYVDNPASASNVLKLAFPTLGSGLFAGDSGVRGDVFHMIELIKDTITPKHASWPACLLGGYTSCAIAVRVIRP